MVGLGPNTGGINFFLKMECLSIRQNKPPGVMAHTYNLSRKLRQKDLEFNFQAS
jgi:hypothetical protein